MFELTEDMKREVCKQVADKIFVNMRETGALQTVVQLAKDKVATQMASDVAGAFHKRVNVEAVVDKAIVDFETRINARIIKTLEKGVTVKLCQ